MKTNLKATLFYKEELGQLMGRNKGGVVNCACECPACGEGNTGNRRTVVTSVTVSGTNKFMSPSYD